MAIYLVNPANGYSERFSTTEAFVGTLLLGPLYFASKGVWGHAIFSAILAFFTYGISWVIYPFAASTVVKQHYLRKGWQVKVPGLKKSEIEHD